MSLYNFKHGGRANRKTTVEYESWRGAKARCYRTTNKKYPNYGGRGIKMCDEWLHNFSQFLLDLGPCPNGCTLNRINNNGNYEPANCNWATKKEQANNRRDNKFIVFNGRSFRILELATRLGVNYKKLYNALTR